MNIKKILTLTLVLLASKLLIAQDKPFTYYKLDNGLSVYLWEDKNHTDVQGSVLFNVGSYDDPEEFTGLAHYLEHVLFKGTEKIGTLNWEKEKPYYEKIIKLYDQFSDSKDKEERAKIEKEINELSIEAGKYTRTNEFSYLIDGMGGKGLNAYTSYDMTVYLNSFPAYQMEKWLELYSERYMNPVFRSFQAELENVFEEYNLYQDMENTHISDFLHSSIFPGTPYGRNVIGSAENLKNPRLSKLIEFYQTWYVPENMALVLVGNFDTEKTKELIAKTFAKLPAKKSPTRKKYNVNAFEKSAKYAKKLAYTPRVYWAYQGVPQNHKDEFLLSFCVQLLSNSSKTGLLDKLTLDGDVLGAAAYLDSRKLDGRVLVVAVPYYDVNQRLFESDKATEKIVMKEVDKIKNGEIEDWLIESVKNEMLREKKLALENPQVKSQMLRNLFIYDLPLDYYNNLPEKIASVTKEDLQRIAKKYLSGNKITVSIQKGKPDKTKLKKPNIKPVDQQKTGVSEYAKFIQNIPVSEVAEKYNDFNDVKVVKLYDGIRLHYTKNTENDVFSMNLRYGVGTTKMPKLEYATELMNSAGIMPSTDAQTLRREFSELGGQCRFSVSSNYFNILLLGNEAKLKEICNLMTRQILMPKLDDKQLNQLKGGVYNGRYVEQKEPGIQEDALLSYAMYGEKSSYLDRLALEDVLNLKRFELTGEIVRATDYELDVFYTGKLSVEELVPLLKANLPLKQNVKPSESPIVKERVTYEKPKILFLPNKNVQQAKVYFYINGKNYTIADDVEYAAFRHYLSGSFNGLLMQEIRESNSMAYTTYGMFSTPPLQNKKSFFLGFVGTQPDKVADAIDLYVKIISDMPQYPDRMENVRTSIKQSYLTDKPSFRNKALVYDAWKKVGYSADPAKVNMEKIKNIQFDEIVKFYEENVKGKPITIVIMSDPKHTDLKQIKKKYGKITKIRTSKIFSK